jgi:PAS domain S-box-containing protein
MAAQSRGEEPKAARILLIADRPGRLVELEAALAPLGQKLVRASSAGEAVARVCDERFAVIVLDVLTPGIDGVGTASLIRAQERGLDTPIIFLTGGETPALERYVDGAVDILRDPLDAVLVRAKVSMFVELSRTRDRLAALERGEQARNAALLNASLDAIVGMDHAGRISEFNSAAEAMFGRRRADVVGQGLADLLIPPHLREAHGRGLARYLTTGHSRVLGTRVEVEAMRADGTVFPVELAIGRIGASDPPSFLGYIRDLTAQREAVRERAELLARAREAQAQADAARAHLHGVLMQLPFPVVVTAGADHVLTVANPAYLQVIGRNRDEVLGKPARQVLPEVAPHGSVELLDRVYASGEPFFGREMPAQVDAGDGRLATVYFNSVYAPYRDAEGRLAGITGAAFDVTEQVRARQQLEAAEAQFRRIFESNMIGFLFTTADGGIVDANDYFLRMLGFTRDDLRAGEIRWDLLTTLEDQGASARAVERLRTAGVAEPIEKEYLRKDGSRVPAVLGSARLPTPRNGAEFVSFVLDISDRKALEAERERLLIAAKAAEEQFRTLADTMPVLAWYAEPDGYIPWYNRRWHEYTGMPLAEQEGWKWQSVHDPADLPRILERWRAALARGEPWEDTFRLRRHDGAFRWFLSRAVPLRDASGRIVRWFGTNADIEAQKRAEAAQAFLAQASEALASSLDYEATLQTLVRQAVPHVADWCSVELVAEQPGLPVRVAVAHVDPAKVVLAEEVRRRYPPDPEAPFGAPQVIRTGQSQLYEDITDGFLEILAHNREHLQLLRDLGLRSAMVVPIALGGRTLGAMSFVAGESGRRFDRFDLTVAEELGRRVALAIENARLYRASQAAEARNRFLAEATGVLSSSLDHTMTLERVAGLAVPTMADMAAVYRLEADGSIRLTALVAGPEEEALARELDALIPVSIAQQDRLLARVVQSRHGELAAGMSSSVSHAWRPTTRAAEILQQLAMVSYMAVPLIVRGRVFGAVTLTTSRSGRRLDAADLALAEELARRASLAIENAQLYGEAQEANRLKDEFLATVSHELRTPLTAILGWIHILKTGRPGLVARAVEIIERNAHAQVRIVEDVLDMSRIITGKLRLDLQRVNLADVITAAVDTVRPGADAKDIEVLTVLDPAVGELVGDPARLQQVAWNLLSNAIKFTAKGGRVEVRLEPAASAVRLRVSDTGQGIAADFLPHVFDRFRQADSASTRAHGGLGLGLAIVRHIVELHGGQVTAHSDGVNRGATFTVTLPIRAVMLVDPPAPSEPESRVPVAGEHAARPLEGLHVLVVDDEADAREFVAALLEQRGAQVTTASSARAAVEAITRSAPDALVSDIGIPGEDGYALVREVRRLGVERGVWFPAIALTAYAHAQDRSRALSAGYQVHLSKPIDPDTLVATIARLVGRGAS